jgi:hypothetical protein
MVTKLEPGIKLKYQNQEKGTWANTVVYNPKLNLYYAAYSGNDEFPLETFDKNGKPLYSTKTGADMRGMWWNSKTEKFEANCYSDGGLVSIEIKSNGYAGGNPKTVMSGRHQPDDQSVGVFDAEENHIIFYKEGKIYKYERLNGNYVESVKLRDIPANLENMNWNTLIFTGQPKMEIGILNYIDKQVYFFDKRTGELTKTLVLPADAPTSDRMRFGFSNNYLWLYNHDERTWIGYRLFK